QDVDAGLKTRDDYKRELEMKEKGMKKDSRTEESNALEIQQTLHADSSRDEDRQQSTNTKAIDADDDVDDEDEDEEEEDEDESEDDEDDTEELLRELAKIKKERAEEKQRLEREKQEMEEKAREEAILTGNPLLSTGVNSQALATRDFSVKRRWDDDVIFKNQAKGQDEKVKKRFINDLLRYPSRVRARLMVLPYVEPTRFSSQNDDLLPDGKVDFERILTLIFIDYLADFRG
ncbi:hypothetical protein HDU96_010759, partial [Phlyctochytrium bullatum]